MIQAKKIIIALLLTAPSFAFALSTYQDFITAINNIVNAIIPVLMSLGLFYFLYGVVKYIQSGGDETKKTEAKNVIVYGLIGLFVMVAVWGLVAVIMGTFGIETTV